MKAEVASLSVGFGLQVTELLELLSTRVANHYAMQFQEVQRGLREADPVSQEPGASSIIYHFLYTNFLYMRKSGFMVKTGAFG